MRLTPRLHAIANYVNKDSIVADIGTDHGYIPVYLLQKGISKRAIASDINIGPLNNAREYIKSKGLEDKIETRLGNGLEVLKPHEVDTVIIAGMGGLLINEILESFNEISGTIDNFIFQPMVASEDLRRYLHNHNYRITNEILAKEGNKIYEIIYAKHGTDTIGDEIYFEIGKKLFENNDILLKEFLNKKIKKLEQIISNLQKASTQRGKNKNQELKKKYTKLKEMLKSL